MIEFVEFPKISRFSREIIISEKIDGTNGCIYCGEDGEFLVGSCTRWITPETDNQGFARWAYDHQAELIFGLGKGRHFGEWWGSGIQRGYGLPKGEKRFSLFNTIRWCLYGQEPQTIPAGDPKATKMQNVLPECCSLVPVLYRGLFTSQAVEMALDELRVNGSKVVYGFPKPEGIVIYHIAGNVAFKKTIEKDDEPKSNKKENI